MDLSSRTYVVGILNVTPDSFSDGGKFFRPQDAHKRALRMVEEGADIIDVGGQSTRPGSENISLEEELRRVIPLVRELAKKIQIPISVDTYSSQVALAALDAGAEMINDISGLRFDSKMAGVVARCQAGLVLMHIQGTPKNMQEDPHYDDLLEEIKDYLRESIKLAEQAGIKEDKIIIDPGIGFGKKIEHNLSILKNLRRFEELGKPIMVGTSRKSFIGKLLDLPVEDRLEGSLASVAVSILNGANIVRVHDVGESVRVARLVDAIMRSCT